MSEGLYEGDIALIPMKNCEHIFHNQCFVEYIKTNVSLKKINITCPEDGCKN